MFFLWWQYVAKFCFQNIAPFKNIASLSTHLANILSTLIRVSWYFAWWNYRCGEVLWQKSRNFYHPDFSPERWKRCIPTVLIIWGKGVFHNLTINNKVHFLIPHFLLTKNKPLNCNIPYKYADMIFTVFVFIIYEIIIIHKKQEKLNNFHFLG